MRRPFVKRFYSNDTVTVGGQQVPVAFPTPRVKKVTYDLDAVLPGFFDRLAKALTPEATPKRTDALTLARYAPSQYRKHEPAEHYEMQLAGLLRSALLKRFESSPCAFAETCERMANSHDAFLALLQQGRVATGEELADWIATDSDDWDGEHRDAHLGSNLNPSHDIEGYDVERLRADVDRDRQLSRSFAQEARTVTRADDPNLAALVEELATIAAEAKRPGIGAQAERDRRKVLIFSYFADTVEWVFEHLEEITQTDGRLADYRGRIASLTGSSGSGKRAVLWGFAPRTTDAPDGFSDDLYDIVVATDVLAEGVNLQQARHIINYDLPWNPMRLVQRHGRIDRIGSSHDEVFLRCVMPDSRLDDLLGLEERLHSKIAQAAASVGVDAVIPDQAEVSDINFAETREEIERLRNEDPSLFERGSTVRGALSGEEFRQEVRAALSDPSLAEQIKSLPWGSGSGMAVSAAGKQPGYVFCARVGDHSSPVFRFVTSRGQVDRGTINDEILSCLADARPSQSFDTPRQLDDAGAAGAFAAWEQAQADIVRTWNFLADKANLEPKIVPRLQRAAEVLRDHPPSEMNQEEIEKAIDTIHAPYPERTIRTFKAAMDGSDEPKEQARNILGVIDDLGLQPYEAPQPLPEIARTDVHLIVWLALV